MWKRRGTSHFFGLLQMRIKKPGFPGFRVMIKADGSVKPCCTSYGDQLDAFGNIHNEDIQEIWNSDKFKNFQSLHKDYRWQENDVCRKCINSTVFYE